MKRSLLLLAVLTGAAYGARAADQPARDAFDGALAREGLAVSKTPRDWGPLSRYAAADGRSLNFCAPDILRNPRLPRGQFVLDERLVCEGARGGDAAADFAAWTVPGAAGGSYGGAGIRAAEGGRSLENSDFRRRVRAFYGKVRAAGDGVKPGWAWTLALAAADGDAPTAARLAAYCGHDDFAAPDLREPRTADDARLLYEGQLNRVLHRLTGAEVSAPLDPLSTAPAALAANDRLADKDRQAAIRADDFAEARESVCPEPSSPFYRTDGLGAGLPAGAEHRRAYAGALFACELAKGGASAAAARTIPANGAWVDRLIRIGREARAILEKGAAVDGGALGELNPSRADAFRLLAAWDPEKPFPGPGAPAKPKAWPESRYRAARRALDALGAEWTRGVDEYAAGARFGASVCAAR